MKTNEQATDVRMVHLRLPRAVFREFQQLAIDQDMRAGSIMTTILCKYIERVIAKRKLEEKEWEDPAG